MHDELLHEYRSGRMGACNGEYRELLKLLGLRTRGGLHRIGIHRILSLLIDSQICGARFRKCVSSYAKKMFHFIESNVQGNSVALANECFRLESPTEPHFQTSVGASLWGSKARMAPKRP